MTRTRQIVLASSTVLVLAGTAAAFASGSGHRRAVPARPGQRAASVSLRPWSGPPRAGLRGRDGLRPFGLVGLNAAADYLQLPVATLAADLRSGKTLAQVADATSGKSASGLVDFLVAKVQAALDAAVKAGRLSSTRESAILSRVTQRIAAVVNGTPPMLPLRPLQRPGAHFGLGLRGGLQAAADYLQIPVSTLLADLRSGKTLAQVADSTPGKSASGLIDALVTHEQTALDAAVKAGRLTPAQESMLTANLQARITALVNGTLRAPALPFAPRFGFGPRDHPSGHPAHGVNA